MVVPSRELADRINARWPIHPLSENYRGEVAKRWRFDDGEGRDRVHLLGIPAVLRELLSGAAVLRGEVLYLPFRDPGSRFARRGARRRLGSELLQLIRGTWGAERSLQRAAGGTPQGPRAQARRRSRCTTSAAEPMSFSHLDADRRPTMVDVSDKTATKRTAVAEARVHFPAAVAAALREQGLRSSKGPIFDTAIIAGVMGAKRTHELIPFCHPLGIESCLIAIELEGNTARDPLHGHRAPQDRRRDGGADRRERRGAYRLRHVQGAFPRHRDLRCAAHGEGRRQEPPLAARPRFERGARPASGSCSRAAGARACSATRRPFSIAARASSSGPSSSPPDMDRVFVSVRACKDAARARYPLIVDSVPGEGPIVGIRSALAAHPGNAWLVLACDLPFLSDRALSQLLAERDPPRARRRSAARMTACPSRCARSGSRKPLRRSLRSMPQARTARVNS